MAPDSSWMEKLRSALTASPKGSPPVGVMAFEAAAVMSRLLHLWRCLSDPHRIRRRPLALPATRKLVSEDPASLLSLARAEVVESIRQAGASIHLFSRRCSDASLRRFRCAFEEFVAAGEDPHQWSMSSKEMSNKARKMERYISATAALYKKMDALAEREQHLSRLLRYSSSAGKITAAVTALQQKIFWQREEVTRLKDASLWRRSFDTVTSLLARAVFSVFSRVNHVLPAAPSERDSSAASIWAANSAVLVPAAGTLGADALSLRYANVIAVVEKMVSSPRLIGPDARDDLYGMLPASVKGKLRARLKGVGGCAATDAGLAAEWRAAMDSIVEWLAPAAHNTLRWQAERSFEKRGDGGGGFERAAVMLTETLHYASRERTEEAVVEMLVGLNYLWRFEVEMEAKAAALAAGVAALGKDADAAPPQVGIDYLALSPSPFSISEHIMIASPLHTGFLQPLC